MTAFIYFVYVLFNNKNEQKVLEQYTVAMFTFSGEQFSVHGHLLTICRNIL